jgi:hypothetical protein
MYPVPGLDIPGAKLRTPGDLAFGFSGCKTQDFGHLFALSGLFYKVKLET